MYRLAFLMIILGHGTASFALAVDVGETLYRKHCGGCHPNPLDLKTIEAMVLLMREPPVPMPAFGVEKLSEENAREVDAYIRARRERGNASRPPTFPEPANSSPVDDPVYAVTSSLPAGPDVQKPAQLQEPVRSNSRREKKPRLQRFVRSWTLKTLRNGEAVSLLKFEVAANKRHDLYAVPLVSLKDYAVHVTDFKIGGNKMKLELTWSWKRSPAYWKVETFDMTMSENGKKLSGSYAVRNSGGQNITSTVWGE